MRFPPRLKQQASILLAATFVFAGCAARDTSIQGVRLPTQYGTSSSWRMMPQAGVSTRSSTVPDDLLFSDLEESDPDFGFEFEHPRVNDFVERFRTKNRNFFQQALARAGKYLPRMTAIMQEEGLPKELAYLPFIESGFRTQAVSHAGAVGPWQFIRGTGRRYGLRIDQYVDERRDPVKSTRAAAHYLRDLYEMFGDWHLSLAAYNTGEERIARIKARRGVQSYWEMMEKGYLHPETRDYVPQFLAAVEIARSPEAHGFDESTEEPLRYEVIKVERSVSLRTMAKLAGVPAQEIADLNPALVRGITPPGQAGYGVRVPEGTKPQFAKAYERILRDASDVQAQPVFASAAGTYRIRKGDTPSGIARRFRISVEALVKANGWKNAKRIKPGMVARIPNTEARGIAQVKSEPTGRQAKKEPAQARMTTLTYRVRTGDTPAGIAKRFGVPVRELMRQNGWRNARLIKPGMLARISVSQKDAVRLAAKRGARWSTLN